MSTRVAALVAMSVLAMACGSGATTPEFDIFSMSTVNTSYALRHYVASYHGAMDAVVGPGAGANPQAPQATKLLQQTKSMLQEDPSKWGCGCEVVFTLWSKWQYVTLNTAPGPLDSKVPTIVWTCAANSDCPGVLSSSCQAGHCRGRPSCAPVPGCSQL